MRFAMQAAILFLALAQFAFADENAISQSGKRVVLKADGTWISAPDQAVATKDFRNCRWGMTRQQVLQAEGVGDSDITHNDSNYFATNATVSGMSCQVIYIFAYDKLVRTKYYITESHTNKNLYIQSDFPKLKAQLVKKYGDPSDDGTVWSNDLYKDDPQNWGTALSFGQVSFHAQWNTHATSVYLYLSGDNFTVSFGIEYTSAEWGYLETKQQEEADLNKL